MDSIELAVSGISFEINYLNGHVVGKEKTVKTHVYGNTKSGVSSTNSVIEKIFIQDKNGKEHVVELANWDIACREGHEMTVVWVIRKPKKWGPYVAVKNISMNQMQYYRAALANIAHKPDLFPGFMMYLIGILLLPAYMYCFHFFPNDSRSIRRMSEAEFLGLQQTYNLSFGVMVLIFLFLLYFVKAKKRKYELRKQALEGEIKKLFNT